MKQSYHQKLHQEKINYWQPILTAWQESGLSAKDYCKSHHLNLYQFKYWQYQLLPETKRKSKWEKACTLTFTPVVVEPQKAMPMTSIELQTPNRYCLKIASDVDEVFLSRLLRLLGGCL